MDTWERLVLNSSLPASGYDAYNHLNAQVGGGDVTVVGMGEYAISYLAEEKKILHIPDTDFITIVFNSPDKLIAEYTEINPMTIKYVEPLETEVVL